MDKKVPTRNYIILVGLVILVVCLCMALSHLYNLIENNKIKVSPLSSTSNEITLDELKKAKVDLPADVFLVVGYTKDKVMNKHEKEIAKVLTKNNLMDSVYYIDAYDYLDNKEYVEELNKVLKIDEKKQLKKIPAIIYISNSEITYTIDSTDKLIDSGDIQKIIDMYEIASK
jgi:hypothetical protein